MDVPDRLSGRGVAVVHQAKTIFGKTQIVSVITSYSIHYTKLYDTGKFGFEAFAIAALIIVTESRTLPANHCQAFIQAGPGVFIKDLIEGAVGWFFVLREMIRFEIKLQIAALGDGHRVGQCLGLGLEQFGSYNFV